MDENQEQHGALLKKLAELPVPVRNAITSASVENHLRELAQRHKLHLDQWQQLENEVMMALVGLESVQDLAENIKNEVGIPAEMARAVAADISKIVFDPIREELERQLEHPSAVQEEVTDIEAAGNSVLAQKEVPKAPTVEPATPPAPAPSGTVARAPASGAYKPGEASTVRKNVVDDPYREPIA